MASDVGDGFANRRRANEDEYFRKRDQELAEKARLRVEEEAGLRRFSEAAGTFDEDIVRDLLRLGYTTETVVLLYIVPLIYVAWADGQVSERECGAVVSAARTRGVEPGSRADRQVAQWLANPPPSVLSDGTLHALGALLERGSPDAGKAGVHELLESCTAVAEASGGILGFRTISDSEQRALDRIRYELERKSAPTSAR